LEAANYDVISLQTGLLDVSEGVPRFGRIGEFLGFRNFSGREFTVPNVSIMTSIAESASLRGLYIRAENPDTVERMLQFISRKSKRSKILDASFLAVLGMFVVVATLCGRLVK